MDLQISEIKLSTSIALQFVLLDLKLDPDNLFPVIKNW